MGSLSTNLGEANSRSDPREGGGKVVFVGVAHRSRADFMASLGSIQDAVREAQLKGRDVVILKEFGGPNLDMIQEESPRISASALVQASDSMPDVRAAMAGFLEKQRQEYLDALALAYSGKPRLLQEHENSGFEEEFLQWVSETRHPVVIEDVTFESWLAGLHGQVADDEANRLLGATGLQSAADRAQFFAIRNAWLDAMATNFRLRNEQITEQALTHARQGKQVIVLIGANHVDIVTLLRAAGMMVDELTTLLSDPLQSNRLVRRRALGESVSAVELRRAMLDELVAGLLFHLQSIGDSPQPTTEFMRDALPLAARWSEADVFGLCAAVQHGTWQHVIQEWLLRHGTPEERRRFGLVTPTKERKRIDGQDRKTDGVPAGAPQGNKNHPDQGGITRPQSHVTIESSARAQEKAKTVYHLNVKTSKPVAPILLAIILIPLSFANLVNGFVRDIEILPAGLGLMLLATFGLLTWLAHRDKARSVRYFTGRGLRRTDGKFLAWADLDRVIYQIRGSAVSKRRLWRTEIRFKNGETARLYMLRVRNAREVEEFVRSLSCNHLEERV